MGGAFLLDCRAPVLLYFIPVYLYHESDGFHALMLPGRFPASQADF